VTAESVDALRDALAGRYRLEREIAAGGMATVYLVHDLKHDRQVALKVMRGSVAEYTVDRFLREIRVTARLSHPHILPLLDSGEARGLPFYVMPFIDGETLRDRMAREGRLPLDDAIRIALEVADALAYAHAQGVIHRDIKPANILLAERDDIKISDFGTAKISHATHTQIDGFLGSPAYMSPEQINEEGPSVQSDIYSLGVVMYELLTGKLPFRAENSVAMINKILNEEPIPLDQLRPDLPGKLVEIVKKAMAKDPRKRYQTWFEMASDLADTFPQLERYSTEISSTEKFNKLRALPFGMKLCATVDEMAAVPRLRRPQAVHTLELIRSNGPFPFARDGIVFGNRERRLPARSSGYYREYTVKTPGERTRGARRIVAGAAGELYYTDDHYNHFRRIRE